MREFHGSARSAPGAAPEAPPGGPSADPRDPRGPPNVHAHVNVFLFLVGRVSGARTEDSEDNTKITETVFRSSPAEKVTGLASRPRREATPWHPSRGFAARWAVPIVRPAAAPRGARTPCGSGLPVAVLRAPLVPPWRRGVPRERRPEFFLRLLAPGPPPGPGAVRGRPGTRGPVLGSRARFPLRTPETGALQTGPRSTDPPLCQAD